MIRMEDKKETDRLIALNKGFDKLSPFGKELMFSFLMGYTQATREEDTFEIMIEEMKKLIRMT